MVPLGHRMIVHGLVGVGAGLKVGSAAAVGGSAADSSPVVVAVVPAYRAPALVSSAPVVKGSTCARVLHSNSDGHRSRQRQSRQRQSRIDHNAIISLADRHRDEQDAKQRQGGKTAGHGVWCCVRGRRNSARSERHSRLRSAAVTKSRR
jgi:hypothetical protein